MYPTATADSKPIRMPARMTDVGAAGAALFDIVNRPDAGRGAEPGAACTAAFHSGSGAASLFADSL